VRLSRRTADRIYAVLLIGTCLGIGVAWDYCARNGLIPALPSNERGQGGGQ
jgi:hypothetical protein